MVLRLLGFHIRHGGGRSSLLPLAFRRPASCATLPSPTTVSGLSPSWPAVIQLDRAAALIGPPRILALSPPR